MSGVANRLVAARRQPKAIHSHTNFSVARGERPRPLDPAVGRPLVKERTAKRILRNPVNELDHLPPATFLEDGCSLAGVTRER
jgi:hypothetical protein